MGVKGTSKSIINQCLSLAGLRVVNARWGPCGFRKSLRQLRERGVYPEGVIDVGASDGGWSLECMKVFPDSKYLLIDPLPENKAKLERLASARSKVTFWSGCLGAEAGTARLHTRGDQSSLFESRTFSVNQDSAVDVEVRTLDSFLGKGVAAHSLIKLDVQGAELDVLKGATRALESADVLLIEVSFRPFYQAATLAHEVISFVGAAGFGIYDICTYVQRARDGQLNQSDIMFLKLNSPILKDDAWE
jgi:FkbM family methyltransferase